MRTIFVMCLVSFSLVNCKENRQKPIDTEIQNAAHRPKKGRPTAASSAAQQNPITVHCERIDTIASILMAFARSDSATSKLPADSAGMMEKLKNTIGKYAQEVVVDTGMHHDSFPGDSRIYATCMPDERLAGHIADVESWAQSSNSDIDITAMRSRIGTVLGHEIREGLDMENDWATCFCDDVSIKLINFYNLGERDLDLPHDEWTSLQLHGAVRVARDRRKEA